MPNWNQLLDELRTRGSTHDIIRRDYLKKLHTITNRNVIAYYSGWLQKGILAKQGIGFELNDGDKTGFMSTIHQLDRSIGLDLILHTPGGSMSALESLVDYLRQMFDTNIRAIVPQLAMSAGTMLALACKEIVMGKHSSLGPIDPQIYGLAAHAILEEFKRASEEISKDQYKALVWQPILQKYNPTLITSCEKAIKWSEVMVRYWLETGMFKGMIDTDSRIDSVITGLGSHDITLAHDRHISLHQARELGISVINLEEDPILQDTVLSVHHTFIQTLSDTAAYKIIENHNGVAFILNVQTTVSALS